jgi:hypothetical protein
VRLVLPVKHLDYARPFQHFDPGFDPLLHKPRSTLAPESWVERRPGTDGRDAGAPVGTPPPEVVP